MGIDERKRTLAQGEHLFSQGKFHRTLSHRSNAQALVKMGFKVLKTTRCKPPFGKRERAGAHPTQP
jgi:hypothetical protein